MDDSHARMRAAGMTLSAALAVGALWWCRPTAVGATGGPDELVVETAAWAAWLLAGYLAVAVAAASVTRVGAATARLARVVDRATPAVVRRVVDAVVGASVVATTLAGPAAYAGQPPSPRPATVDLDWPGLGGGSSSPAAGHAGPAPRPRALPPASTATKPPTAAATVVVRPGDTLWGIAARRLPPDASRGLIAAAWPQWWAANRAVIGDNPALIHPGQRLRVPSDSAAARSTS